MLGVKAAKLQLTQQWQHTCSDYITDLVWSPDGQHLAAASAQGDVRLYPQQGNPIILQPETGQAISCLGFSGDSQLLAAGGQSGTLMLWDIASSQPLQVWSLASSGPWIDQLAWHPRECLLAYGLGADIHFWQGDTPGPSPELTLPTSSVLSLAWHPDGTHLAASGHGGVYVWQQDAWHTTPTHIAVPGASLHVAWSGDGQYLGSGNLDRTLTVMAWGQPPPWLMQGFPGKVRQIAWSPLPTTKGHPVLAAACIEGITLWERGTAPNDSWRSQVLQHHRDRVNHITFQPKSRLLASASQDGTIALWRGHQTLVQTLKGFSAGVSQVAWHPSGDYLAAGSGAGEIRVWSVSEGARGFG